MKKFLNRNTTFNLATNHSTDRIMFVTSSNDEAVPTTVEELVIEKSDLKEDEVVHFEITIKPVVRKIPYLVDMDGTHCEITAPKSFFDTAYKAVKEGLLDGIARIDEVYLCSTKEEIEFVNQHTPVKLTEPLENDYIHITVGTPT